MKEKVLTFIQENHLIFPKQRVLIAVSGGADSMALLHLFFSCQDILQCEIAAAHLHHNIRGEEADRDARFVQNYCEEKKIPFYFNKTDVPALARLKKIGLEAAGRQARYLFFDALMHKEGYDLLATAHHLDDQAETLLMRLIRGTGLKGACGIAVQQKNIIRPLLCVTKKEIEDYCQQHGLCCQYDQTNADLTITRNRIRHQVLPILTSINQEASRHLSDFCVKSAEAQQFLDHIADQTECQLFETHPDHCDIKELEALHPYLKKEMLRRGLYHIGQTITDIEQRHIHLILKQLSKPTTVWQLDLPNGILVRREYEHLFFERRVANISDEKIFECCELPLDHSGTFIFQNFCLKIELLLTKELISSEYYKKRCEIFLNCDTIDKSICIRNRQPGDRILLPGTKGHKKVKKLLIDRKVPKEIRDRLPVIAMGREVLWIPEVAVDQRCVDPDPISETTIKITMESLNEPGH